MAHPEGFEPPTARFVAEYSIQLSYGCMFSFSLLVKGSDRFDYLNSTSDDFISRLNMAHPEGFEPPTARFVAEYSIQLSYGCVFNFSLLVKDSDCFDYLNGTSDDFISRLNMAHPEGFEPPTARFVAEYSIQLSYGCVFNFSLLVKCSDCFDYLNGTSDDFISRLNMAHPEGFEPPTARFVAEYSIQLSYGCMV